MQHAQIMVRVYRGDMVESIHRGHVAVVNSQGHLLASLGNPNTYIYARSAAKPLQTIPVIEAGAPAKYGFREDEIAVMCASHNGEEEHTRTVHSILEKIGRTTTDLTCGIHEPYHKATAQEMKAHNIQPTPLHNNCSGKHSGMLALACARDYRSEDYSSVEHPVQKEMLRSVAEMSQTPIDEVRLGVDGCGVPVFGLPLDRLARAFARLGDPADLSPRRREACQLIIRSLRAHPQMIAGHDRFDTQLIEATSGQIIGKMGAEAVFALTVPERSLGIAMKIEDGSLRGLYPAILEVLRQLELVTSEQLEALHSFYRPDVRNHSKNIVGRIESDFTLHPGS